MMQIDWQLDTTMEIKKLKVVALVCCKVQFAPTDGSDATIEFKRLNGNLQIVVLK